MTSYARYIYTLRNLISILFAFDLLLLVCQIGTSQDLNSIQKELEDQVISLKIDMPASDVGIDLLANSEVPLDEKVYTSRIREYGVSVFKGDTITITKVEQKNQSIIIYLGIGGYHHNEHLMPTDVKPILEISEKEHSLKKEITEEIDKSKLAKLNRDLNKLKRLRRFEQERINTSAAESKKIRAEKEYIKIKESGSRIYINFQTKIEQSDFDLNKIKHILSNYLVLDNNYPAQSSELIIKSDIKKN